jgi:hypothetical protein
MAGTKAAISAERKADRYTASRAATTACRKAAPTVDSSGS